MGEQPAPVAEPNFVSPSSTIIVHRRWRVVITKPPILQKPDKAPRTLRAAAGGIIVLQDRHVAGALIPLELPLGCAKYISLGSCGVPVETRACAPDSRFFHVRHFKRCEWIVDLRRGCPSFSITAEFLAD